MKANHRRLLALVLVFIFSETSAPLANVCTCTGACTLDRGTNWSGAASCTTSGPTETTDAIEVAGGGSLDWNVAGTRTYDYLWVHAGGTVTVSASPVVMVFDGPTFRYEGVGSDVFFGVGDPKDDRGTFTSDGKDLTINWSPAGTQAAVMILGPHGNGGSTDNTTTNYTAVTMRGIQRASTRVAAYSPGVTAPTPDTDMVDCMDGTTPPTGGAVGDTIVFTSGRSRGYWYEVSCYPDQCTGPGAPFACCSAADATTECSATACAGGPCDYQVTRNSTGSTPGSVANSHTWNSMVKSAGAGGPVRQGVPDDADADGAADGDGLRPQSGDTFDVFKPVLIQGKTNPIENGITIYRTTAGINWKYVEVNKGSGHLSEDCDPDNNEPAADTLWDMGTKILAPDGNDFINVHDYISRLTPWEISYTDDPDDVKPNVPRTYNWIYVHDVDSVADTICRAVQGQNGLAPGIAFGIDTTVRKYDGIVFNGLHVARWGDGAAVSLPTLDLGANSRSIRFYQPIIHDYPGIATFGKGCSAFSVQDATQLLVVGLAAWDLGLTSRGCNGVSFDAGGVEPSGEIVTAQFENAFLVNIDSNSNGSSGADGAGGGAFVAGTNATLGETTKGATISNSYISRIVGAAAYGGREMFDFIKDTNMEDDGAAPCDSTNPRGALHSPVDAVGNVVTRGQPLSCMGNAVVIGLRHASAFTDRTRRIESNVFRNMDTDASVPINGILWGVSSDPTRDTDVYNNIIDGRGNRGNAVAVGLSTGGYTYSLRITAHDNIVMNWTSAVGYAGWFGLTPKDIGHNRYYNIAGEPAIFGGDGPGDVDSDDEGVLLDPANDYADLICDRPERARFTANIVGPLRYGITTFRNFHPSVIPFIDAEAFTMRFDWRSCGATRRNNGDAGRR